ncbi:MAG TPA: sulfotransferase [Steroidobacteraceae bacterium]|nr:sulfotransferase [Steroidobacteraceae bacterium]
MLLNWLNVREATAVGTALADEFVLQQAKGGGQSQGAPERLLQWFLQRVDREARPLQLNIFKRAQLANSFKWRLREQGVEPQIIDELTQTLLVRLATSEPGPPATAPAAAPVKRRAPGNAEALRVKGDGLLTRGAYTEAVECYQQLLDLDPRNAVVGNNLGVALCRLGRLREAEAQFRRVIGIRGNYPDVHCNLGNLLRTTGRVVDAEMPLRRALKLKPTHLDAQVGLGMTLFLLNRVPEARIFIDKALQVAPRNVAALLAMGGLEARDGRFAEAEALFKRALEIDPKAAGAWAGLAGLRRMTSADGDWLKGAQACAASELEPLEEASIRYAIGKYYDDLGEYARAFRSYQRANELQREVAQPYDRDARARFVDDLVHTYTRERLSHAPLGASDSALPVFVVGMPRSGTSLIEQILVSHPSVKGAGELPFWSLAARQHEAAIRQEPPGEALTSKLAAGYLRTLARHAADALRVVDKSPFNSDYLGLIHWVFPNARMIYMQRDPIDTCLSCYFSELPAALEFTMDLSDLAHYYREHRRLISHWRSTLPAGTLLEVPYEQLVADQERWTRRILDFLGLNWDARCLEYQLTEGVVLTASYWQVRQKLYGSSVGRWRNYQKFIGPLLSLGKLDT